MKLSNNHVGLNRFLRNLPSVSLIIAELRMTHVAISAKRFMLYRFILNLKLDKIQQNETKMRQLRARITLKLNLSRNSGFVL